MADRSAEALPRQGLGTTEQVAEYIAVPPRTLDQWAWKGTGPKWSKVGRHRRYRWSDVDAWLESQSSGGEAVA